MATLFSNGRLPEASLVDIAVRDGRIEAISAAGTTPGRAGETVVDLGGRLVLPGLVEGHIHLDTSFYGGKWTSHRPCTNGFDVRERVAFQHENMALAEPMDVRARKQLELCIANGTTATRSHIMVDASVGLSSLETILAVREEYRSLIDLQLVAFPQSGLLTSPGTSDLLDKAIEFGADLVGGLDPGSLDRDIEGHLAVVFGVAARRGSDVDIHLHDAGTFIRNPPVAHMRQRFSSLCQLSRKVLAVDRSKGMNRAPSRPRLWCLLGRSGYRTYALRICRNIGPAL